MRIGGLMKAQIGKALSWNVLDLLSTLHDEFSVTPTSYGGGGDSLCNPTQTLREMLSQLSCSKALQAWPEIDLRQVLQIRKQNCELNIIWEQTQYNNLVYSRFTVEVLKIFQLLRWEQNSGQKLMLSRKIIFHAYSFWI